MAFLLEHALERRTAAGTLRAYGVADGTPVLSVCREAAYCHPLLHSGRHDLVVDRLHAVLREAADDAPPSLAPRPADGVDALLFAADVFAQLRSTVSNQYPGVFTCPALA